jgi:pyruvate,orthophosphate dikinase
VQIVGAGHNEGRAEMRNRIGGKGANLVEMASSGRPAAPGVTTDLCTAF